MTTAVFEFHQFRKLHRPINWLIYCG